MANNSLISLSKDFAINIINSCANIPLNSKIGILKNQLLKSGTSIGANIHEANYGASGLDFINKLHIALKECYESEYWLDIFAQVGAISNEEYATLHSKCCKIRIILISSIKTAKEKNGQI